jgi:3-hydroxyacyl-[acyl-carrier-protein] dehydratase
MFLNNLYQVLRVFPEDKGTKFSVIIELNPSHEIFTGHFPGNPILPGVCMVQIIKELLINYLNCKLTLKNAGSIKYLTVIDPRVNKTIQFDLETENMENGDISCKAVLNSGPVIYCRFKGEFRITA